jgi:hypothetical protein
MKLGTGADSVNSISLHLEYGWEGPGNAENETSILHNMIDKSYDVVEYGSRVRRKASVKFVDLSKTDYLTLIDYLDDNQGQVIKVEQENDGEKIFTEANYFTTYYVNLLKWEGAGELDFSASRERFEVSVQFSFVGENSTDKPNVADSSLIDVLIKVDTAQADYIQSGIPTGDTGEIWLDTDDNKLYEAKSDGSNQIISGEWEFLYTLAPDDSTYGFKDGVFYWSLFSDQIQDLTATPNTVEQDYVSGYINKNSLSLPTKSVNLKDGPTIAYKQGFTFRVKNEGPFWKYITDNSISLYGSKVTVYLFNDDSGTTYAQKIATGTNNSNQFGYTDYEFKCEPNVLNKNDKHPSTYVDSGIARYANTKNKFLNKPSYVTYGKWENAALQNISSEKKIIEILEGDPNSTNRVKTYLMVGTLTLNGADYTDILISKTGNSGVEIDSEIVSDIISNPSSYALYITSDSNDPSDNVNEARTISNLSQDASNYTFSINVEFPTDPSGGSKATFYLIKHSYEFQMNDDENNSGGFFIDVKNTPDGVDKFNEGIRLFGLANEGQNLIEIPSNGFQENSEKNLVSLYVDESVGSENLTSYNSVSGLNPPVMSFPPSDLYKDDTFVYNAVNYKRMTTPLGELMYGNMWQQSAAENHVIIKSQYDKADRITYNFNYSQNKVVNNYDENPYILGVSYPISHANDEQFSGFDSYRLSMDFDFICNFSEGLVFADLLPAPFEMKLRFLKRDGSYVSPHSSWTKSFPYGSTNVGTGVQKEVMGKMSVKNFPDGNKLTGGFGLNIQEPTSYYDYIARVFDLESVLLTQTASGAGTLFYAIDTKKWYKAIYGTVTGFVEITGSYPTPSQGDKVWDQFTNDIYEVQLGGGLSLIDPSTYNLPPVLKGQDLFVLDSLFSGETPEWDNVVSMEVIFVLGDMDTTDHYKDKDGVAIYQKGNIDRLFFDLKINNTPTIYYSEKINISDKPIFSAVKGRELSGDPEDAKEIIKDIMNEMHGEDNWVSSSLDSIPRLNNMKMRKQFYGTDSIDKVLKEILNSIWAVAVLNSDDKIEIKSLNPQDYNIGSPIQTFNDSNIIDGSLSPIVMRNADEIFQKLELEYDFNPPSHFSESFNKYQKSLTLNKDSDIKSDQLRTLLQWSNIMFKNENTFKKSFEYIYLENDMNNLFPIIAKYFLFNAWEFSFKVSLNSILNNTELDYMKYIEVQSHSITNNEAVGGFISGFKPNIYDGTITIKMYIPDPPGKLGPYNDPFNDALNLTTRDITGWTDANGRRNDADRVSTRTIGSYTQKDAGTVSTRNFND